VRDKVVYLQKQNTAMRFYPQTFLINDQPTTCPECGIRTIVIATFVHTNSKIVIHECKSDKLFFIEQDDEDFDGDTTNYQ
jgi:transcription elongation factor Elf1